MDASTLDEIVDKSTLERKKGGMLSVIERAARLEGVLTNEETSALEVLVKAIDSRLEEVEKELQRQEKERERANLEVEKKKQDRIRVLKSRTRQKYVEFDDVTWYEHVSQPKYMDTRSYVGVYFLIDKSGTAQNLRIKNVFTADTWLFIERYQIKTDSQSYDIDKGSYGVERDNDTEIWEWYDDPVDAATASMLRDISTSKSAIIRYVGQQYRHDRTIGAAEKKAIAEMLELFSLLGG
jgi:hypothetical protein